MRSVRRDPTLPRRTAIHLLPLQRMSGSGARRKSMRHMKRKQQSPVNVR